LKYSTPIDFLFSSAVVKFPKWKNRKVFILNY
jgi:hypothetical protein